MPTLYPTEKFRLSPHFAQALLQEALALFQPDLAQQVGQKEEIRADRKRDVEDRVENLRDLEGEQRDSSF